MYARVHRVCTITIAFCSVGLHVCNVTGVVRLRIRFFFWDFRALSVFYRSRSSRTGTFPKVFLVRVYTAPKIRYGSPSFDHNSNNVLKHDITSVAHLAPRDFSKRVPSSRIRPLPNGSENKHKIIHLSSLWNISPWTFQTVDRLLRHTLFLRWKSEFLFYWMKIHRLWPRWTHFFFGSGAIGVFPRLRVVFICISVSVSITVEMLRWAIRNSLLNWICCRTVHIHLWSQRRGK